MQFDLPELIYEGKPALAPQKEDLERLYNLIIKHRATTVLEFGCGYSTLVIGKALEENHYWFLGKDVEVRNPNLWECYCLETNIKWASTISGLCKAKITQSICYATGFNHMACTVYSKTENLGIIPDFIYLDGPDPKQAWEFDMPMSADILYLEPILLPGTVVVIDGRVNNARFLQRNLQRNWTVRMEDDVTIMELDEPRLGKINACGRDLREAVGE